MFQSVVSRFRSNCDDVERLINFDREVLQLVIISLEDLHEKLKPLHGTAQMNGGRVLEIVRGIRSNDSLRNRYGVIFNQAVVLLVSHFAAALGDIFRASLMHSFDDERSGTLFDEEIKLTFREMKDRGWNLKASAADLLIAKKDFNFQDMGSTVRAFDTYVGVKLERDAVVNNLILGQASRHVIVHTGGIASDKMLRQISKAYPRTLKEEIAAGSKIQFSIEEVIKLKVDMIEYVDRLVAAIRHAQELSANCSTNVGQQMSDL